MRQFLSLILGVVLSVMAILSVASPASATPLSIGSTHVISKEQPTVIEQVHYRGYGYRGYGRGYGRHYGYRHYGYGRGYGYRRYGYRPIYYGGYRRCGIRYRTFYNGYRYVRRAVRVCRY